MTARFKAPSETPAALANRRAHAGIANGQFLLGIVVVAAAYALSGLTAVWATDSPSENLVVGTVATGIISRQSTVSADTLAVLLKRILALEAIADSSIARLDSLRWELRYQRMMAERERRSRIEELEGLRASFVSLLDSASASSLSALLSKLEADLRSLRNEALVAGSAMGARVSDIALELAIVDSAVVSLEAAVLDSIAVVNSRIAEEQLHRESGDRLGAITKGIATGLLLIGIGLVWWYSRNRANALDSHLRLIQPETAGKLEEAQNDTEQGVHKQSAELLGKLLGSIEQMAAMLGTIQTLAETTSTASAEPDHELPISICNVINRIERTLGVMGSGVKGHKHMHRCVRDAKASLRLHNYEMPDLLGMTYDTQMENLKPEFSLDERLAPGEQTVTRINRPLVLYHGRPVQGAWVRVSIGP